MRPLDLADLAQLVGRNRHGDGGIGRLRGALAAEHIARFGLVGAAGCGDKQIDAAGSRRRLRAWDENVVRSARAGRDHQACEKRRAKTRRLRRSAENHSLIVSKTRRHAAPWDTNYRSIPRGLLLNVPLDATQASIKVEQQKVTGRYEDQR